ncbi:uncharacterized protein LOC135208190 [Macrobrachium nipponense]|uniref:uncharacterized protein LOC135208190 n=1 Tax=Macrobrachium nipponense TaxID=159736 RepID=UPI0030C824F6
MRVKTYSRDKRLFAIILIIVLYFLLPANVIRNAPKEELVISSDFQVNQITLSDCDITFSLGICKCNRTIRARLPHSCPETFPDVEEVLKTVKATYGETVCGDWATLRGPHQRVASFSVYGPFLNDYYVGIEYILPRLLQTYPGWNMRLYHHMNLSDPKVNEWVCSLACQYPHFDLCDAEKLHILGNVTNSTGRAWRFGAMGDKFVDRFISRDTDSPIYQREVDAVQEWISDGTCFHVMRDHPWHGVPILGGMWGGCNDWRYEEVLNITKTIFRLAKSTRSDQGEVGKHLYHLVQENGTVHDSYTCGWFGASKPFPTQRFGDTFIGQKSLMKFFNRHKLNPCPEKCRPKNHPDWLYC